MTWYGETSSFRLRGGVEPLIEHPATMTHVSMDGDVRDAMGITSDLVRISVGLEDVAAILADLDQALRG